MNRSATMKRMTRDVFIRSIVPYALTLVVTVACGTESGTDDAGRSLDACDDESLVFCADRVDDDCDGGDEPCPATQPADAAPAFTCNGAAPSSVLAHAVLSSNEQVESGCVFVYQSASGAFYAAVSVTDGPSPRGPQGVSAGLCQYDTSARRHVFFTTSPVEDCADVIYTYPDQVPNQLLSTECRRMVRNIQSNDPTFTPDIQFLPGDLAAQEARLARFDTAEVACLGINNQSGMPYRTDEVFVTQSTGAFVTNAAFQPQ
jgi:hypothetical protein